MRAVLEQCGGSVEAVWEQWEGQCGGSVRAVWGQYEAVQE